MSNTQTVVKTGITLIPAGDIGVSGAVALSGYAYAFSTPFTIAAHMNDPYLTSGEKWGLSGMELGLAGGGIALTIIIANCWNPVGWVGALSVAGVYIAYAVISFETSTLVTNYYERKNGKE